MVRPPNVSTQGISAAVAAKMPSRTMYPTAEVRGSLVSYENLAQVFQNKAWPHPAWSSPPVAEVTDSAEGLSIEANYEQKLLSIIDSLESR